MEYLVRGILEEVRRLVDFGEVPPASDEERKIATYVKYKFEETDLDQVEIFEFKSLLWYDLGSYLLANGLRISAVALPYTLPSEVEGRLVHIGLGIDPKDWREKDLEGNIALIQFFKEDIDSAKHQYLEAVERGAIGVIFYDFVPGGILRRIVITGVHEYHYGPSPPPVVPVLAVSLEAGLKLREMCGRRVRLVSNSVIVPESISMSVIGILNGKSEEEILITAHHDHWLTGVGDNLIGTAILVVLSRYLCKLDRKRSIKLISFGSEEAGALNFSPWYWAHGSREYVRVYKKELENVHAVLNIDILTRGSIVLYTSGPEFISFIRNLPGILYYSKITYDIPYFDSFTFTMEGIPSLTLSTMEEYINYYHTNKDSLNRIDRTTLRRGVRILLTLIEELVVKGFEFEYSSIADYIRAKCNGYELRALNRLKNLLSQPEAKTLARTLKKVLTRPYFNGDYRLDIGPFKADLVPQLSILKDIRKIEIALESLKRGKIKEGIKEIENIPRRRIAPGTEEELPSINVVPLVKLLESGFVDSVIRVLNVLSNTYRKSIMSIVDHLNSILETIIVDHMSYETSN